jgi:thiamine transport system substrate-binding protein
MKKGNKNHIKLIKGVALFLIIISSVLSGCLSENDDDGNVTLNIISYDALGISQDLLDQFTNDTGINIEITRAGDAGGVLSMAIQTKNTGLFDVSVGIDNSYLGTALVADIFEPLDTNREIFSERALSSYNGNLAIPFDLGSVCINYDSSYVDGENITVPSSLWNFTESQWEGKIAIENPRTSSPGRAFFISTIDYFDNDEDEETNYINWWDNMKDNNVIITDSWTTAYETHYTGGYGQWGEGFIGDAHAVVSYCHSPGVEAYYGGNWTTSVALDLEGASFSQIEYISMLKGSEKKSSVNIFVDWLVSYEINSQMSTINWMYPSIIGGNLTETSGYRWHSVVPIDCEIEISDIDENITYWLDEWDITMA